MGAKQACKDTLMTKLDDLFDRTLYETAVADGYIRTQTHPSAALTIANYSEKAAYERAWNPATRACRGLIFDAVTGEVVARPLRKFFNYGEADAPVLEVDEPVIVTDKMDGSMGVLYPAPTGWAVATRGSFASEQAIHATAVLHDRYAEFRPLPGWTVIVEIIYPANRIVVDYRGVDDLVLLGAVHIETGSTIPPDDARLAMWTGPRTEVFPYTSLAAALAAPPRANAEGYVVHVRSTDERIKIKQADYVALHRIVTGLTARSVWQHLVDTKPLAELITPLPDEFHGWVRDVARDLIAGVDREQVRLEAEFERLRGLMPEGWIGSEKAGRAVFAGVAARHRDSWAMFALLDGKDIRPKLLHAAKPDAVTPSGRSFTEENA
jgi:RNA ligase